MFPLTCNKEREREVTQKKLVCREALTAQLASDRIDVIGVQCCHCYFHFQATSPCLLTYTEAQLCYTRKSVSFFLRHSGSNLSQFLRMHPNGYPGGIEGVCPIVSMAHLGKENRDRTLELGGASPVTVPGAN